ncbi:uncharacterized protein [Pseudochaenichthys georgianus]|uniref:uncharacterized protein n=1 Tax=Pseudochaenichthys georgianus TaxID=52239 RepID=UPI0039C05141
MTLVAAPLHNVYIHSSLVKGFFKVPVLPALPIKGVDFILSNDLAGGKVKPVPEVIDSPDLSLDAEKSAEVPPEIFPACVVTRAQSKKYGEDLSDSFLATGQFLEDMTVSDRLPEEDRSAGAGSASNGSELVQLPATREEFMAAQFPEAIPLRKITAPVITKALLKFFSMFGLPKVVQTDQGTNFMSKVFARVLDTLGIKHVTSSPYHPESQGALERFHQTMKCMLRKHCHESHKDWDDGVPLVLFAAREAVQESLGFSPAELVFGHEVRGPLRVLKEHLIMPTKTVCSIPEYVAKLKDRLNRACSLAREALTSTQGNMKKRYDQKAVARLFQPDKKLGETNYVIQTPDRRRPTRVCHINMLKKYCTREDQSESSKAHQVETTVSPMASVSKVSSNEDEDELVMRSATPQGARLSNTEVLADLPNYLSHLPDIQGSDIQKLIFDFASLFNDTPSQTSVLAHDVVLTNPSPIKQRAMPPAKRSPGFSVQDVIAAFQNGGSEFEMESEDVTLMCTKAVSMGYEPSLNLDCQPGRCTYPTVTLKSLKKKGRGCIDIRVEANHNICAVKWYTRAVTLVSSFAGPDPVQRIQRWDKANKTYVEVERSYIVGTYNKYMAGVDLLDSFTAKYKFPMKS